MCVERSALGLNKVGESGGYILAPAHDFTDAVSLENKLEFFNAGCELGAYPPPRRCLGLLHLSNRPDQGVVGGREVISNNGAGALDPNRFRRV